MSDMSWEHASEARAALNAIVTDPDHGVAALSNAQTMSNLLKDYLPDAPREKSILVAAAEAGLADTLRDHVAQGMDSNTAIRLTASSFSSTTPFTPEACNWVTDEIALALGIIQPRDPRAGSPVADAPPGPGSAPPSSHEAPTAQGYRPGFGPQQGGQVQGQAGPGQVQGQGSPGQPAQPGFQGQPAPFPGQPAQPGFQGQPAPFPGQPAQGFQAQPAQRFPGQPAQPYRPQQAQGFAGQPVQQGFAGQPAPFPGQQRPGFPGQPAFPQAGQPGAPGGWQPGGWQPPGPGFGGPQKPSGGRRGLLVGGGIVLLVIIAVVVVIALTHKPTHNANGHHNGPSTSSSSSPAGTPSPSAAAIEPLTTIMNPTGLAPVGTDCTKAFLFGLNASTLTSRIFCATTTYKNIDVWGYQFDSHADYLAGVKHINSYTGFHQTSNSCPPTAGSNAGSIG